MQKNLHKVLQHRGLLHKLDGDSKIQVFEFFEADAAFADGEFTELVFFFSAR